MPDLPKPFVDHYVWPSVGSFSDFDERFGSKSTPRFEAVLECSPSNTPEQLKKVGGIRWWEMIWNHGESNGILMEFSCNLVVSMDSHDERHNWDWKAKKGWDMHRVGNTTKNGYRIWKLRTNMHQVRYFFSNWQKTLQKTWININHTTFVWRGISWKAKIAWASDRLKICVAGRQNHDTCGGKVSSGQATLECGWLWRKGGTRIWGDLGCWTSEHIWLG